MNQRRVLWVTKGLGRGGAEQLLVSLAREIGRGQLDLHVAYVLPHKTALVADLRSAGAKVHCLSTARMPWPVQLRRLFTAHDFDLVHTHAPLVGAVARIVAPRTTILLHTEHNVWARYRWPTRGVNRLTMRRNTVVWAVSQGVADSIRPVTHVGAKPHVEVLIHGIGGEVAASGPRARTEGLRRLCLAEGALTIGSVGNLRPKKDHKTLLRAFANLHQVEPNTRLVLIGGGPMEREIRRLIHDLTLDDVVTLAGVRDDVAELLPALDVFALSSRHEGLPIALLEAMAAGLPPVATTVGGVPEAIRDGRDGLLVPPGDVPALTEALRRLTVDPALRESMGRAARTRAEAFGIAPAAGRILEVYRGLTPGIAERAAS